jgi:aldose 1-epimerase
MNNHSPFVIEEEVIHGQPLITVKNKLSGEFFSVLTSSGGRVRELWLNNGGVNISVLRKIENVNSQNSDDIFTSAKLCPFAGRIKDGKYTANNIDYNLPINYAEENNAAHGFVYDKSYSVIAKEVSEEQATCVIQYRYDGHSDGYPFPFTIEIFYSLTLEKGFICTTKILNRSQVVIPLGDGWHHYFDLGCSVNDLKLKLNVKHMMELDKRNIPTGRNILFNDYSNLQNIGERHFNSTFTMNGDNGRVTAELVSESRNIHLSIWQEVGKNKYNYVVVYTPSDRKSIAIEPMTSNVNSFNSGDGLIMLSPDEEIMARMGIQISR